ILRLTFPRKPGAGSAKAAGFTHWPLDPAVLWGIKNCLETRFGRVAGVPPEIVLVLAVFALTPGFQGTPVWSWARPASSQPPISASTIFDEGAYILPAPTGR